MPKHRSKPRTPVVRIFVSSTFRDMIVERDLLATQVFPRLERYLQEHGWVLEVIDLRWGIPKHEVDEGLVVKECRRQIDDARPFFLGLIGSRYGTRVNQLGGVEAHSITEDEIRYGVFRRKSDLKGSVFLVRSDASAARVPTASRSDYLDAAGPDREALLRLRRRIVVSGVRYAEYSATWSSREEALVPYDGLVEQAFDLLRDEMRLRLGIDNEAAVHPHLRLANAQRVAAIRAERRAYCPNSAPALVEQALKASSGGVVRIECPDQELAHAAGLVFLRHSSRRSEGVLALDGRFWTGECSANAVLQFLSTEFHSLGVAPKPRARRMRHKGFQRPQGFREQLESIARSLRKRTTLLLAFPELLVPAGYWQESEWVPKLCHTRLRLVLIGTRAQTPPSVDIRMLDHAEVGAALVRTFAADGRVLDKDLLGEAKECEGLSTAAGRRLFAEVLRSARSSEGVRTRCLSLLQSARFKHPRFFAEHCLREVLGELKSQFGARAMRGLLPFIATTRTGLLDSDCEAVGGAKDGLASIALARRLRRILDVSEGRLRIVGSDDRQQSQRGVDITAEMLVHAGADLLAGSKLHQLHAEVATKYRRARLEVGIRDFVWHAVESDHRDMLLCAYKACLDPSHLARWTRCAPASEIDADFRALEIAVARLPDGTGLARSLRRWRDFVRGTFDRLRDPALDPWQTAHLEHMVATGVAARHTRFAALVSVARGSEALTAGRLGVIAEVSRMRFERSGGALLIERAGLLESFEPEDGTLRIADSDMWRRAVPATQLRRTLRRRKGAVCAVGGTVVETDLGEPIVHTTRGIRAIPTCADALAVRVDGSIGAVLRDESEILSCWRLAELEALPPAHEYGVFELRPSSIKGKSAGPETPAARALVPEEIVSWGFDGQRIEHDRLGRMVRHRKVSQGAIWRVTQSAVGLLLATSKSVIREHDGLQILAGAVGDIAAHADGTILAVANESELECIELLDLAPLLRAERARPFGQIALPKGFRHGFRALHWIDARRLLVGMMKDGEPQGGIGCWNVELGRWAWRNMFEEHENLSLVMGVDLASARPEKVAITLPLVSKAIVLDCESGNTVAALPIHESGGLLHRVDFSPQADRLTTTDRNGLFEIWRLEPGSVLETRVALPFGALTACSNLGSSFVFATEGGRLIRLELTSTTKS